VQVSRQPLAWIDPALQQALEEGKQDTGQHGTELRASAIVVLAVHDRVTQSPLGLIVVHGNFGMIPADRISRATLTIQMKYLIDPRHPRLAPRTQGRVTALHPVKVTSQMTPENGQLDLVSQ